jgi:acetolactate synthase-1/2/3 large subunit
MQRTIGTELISRLEQAGVQVVFGIPGVHNLELYRGLKSSSIRHVAARHEQGLGFMADGYARVSGHFGVCFTITGPGLTNIASAMAQALADSIPMLVVSSENRRDEQGQGRGFLHEIPDQFAIGSQLSRFSARLTQPEDFDRIIDQCLKSLTQGRLGPVYLEIPRDVLALPYVKTEQTALPTHTTSSAMFSATISPEGVEKLKNAKRPLLIVGGGAKAYATQVKELAERLHAPTVMTVNARGIIPKGHPLEVPASPSLQAIRRLCDEADVVLALGSEFGQTDFDMYAVSDFKKPACLIRVDIDEDQLKRNIKADYAVQSDVKHVVADLLKQMPAKSSVSSDWVDRASKAVTEAWQELTGPQQAQVQFLDALMAVLPEAIIIGDSTQPVYSGNLFFSATHAGRWFNSSTGYGTLGYALPATNGASLADSTRPMICLTGDGGLQFTLSELAVSRDENINPVIMVWNNQSFKEIRHSMLAVGIEPEGVEVKPPHLEHIARAYELDYLLVSNLADLKQLVDKIKLKRPLLVEVAPGDFE